VEEEVPKFQAVLLEHDRPSLALRERIVLQHLCENRGQGFENCFRNDERSGRLVADVNADLTVSALQKSAESISSVASFTVSRKTKSAYFATAGISEGPLIPLKSVFLDILERGWFLFDKIVVGALESRSGE
jgi:hypothetical protein